MPSKKTYKSAADLTVRLLPGSYKRLAKWISNKDGITPICLVGSDPGPTHCALAMLALYPNETLHLMNIDYIPNGVLDKSTYITSLHHGKQNLIFSYEKVACQGRIVGATVFDTCSMSGSLRHLFACDEDTQAIFGFAPSAWRISINGFSGSRDAATRQTLTDLGIIANEYYKKTTRKLTRELGLSKPCSCHINDAIAVALAPIYFEERFGESTLAPLCETSTKEEGLHQAQDNMSIPPKLLEYLTKQYNRACIKHPEPLQAFFSGPMTEDETTTAMLAHARLMGSNNVATAIMCELMEAADEASHGRISGVCDELSHVAVVAMRAVGLLLEVKDNENFTVGCVEEEPPLEELNK